MKVYQNHIHGILLSVSREGDGQKLTKDQAAYSPPSSRHFLNFSTMVTKQVCALNPFRKPV